MQQFAALLRKDNQPVRYLVVDDSVFARKNIIKMIEMFGGEVAGEAGDGLTAIAEFNRTKPDIVLMDITMPQMEGIEAVERIVRQHSEARIVMVSSVGYQENILAALQKGAKHFVQKPVKPEVLYEILRYVLSDDPNAAGAWSGSLRGDTGRGVLIRWNPTQPTSWVLFRSHPSPCCSNDFEIGSSLVQPNKRDRPN